VFRALMTALLVAAALTGCGDRSAITAGGEVPRGETLTVYVLVPRTPAGVDLARGAKLALFQAHGRAGGRPIQFATADEPSETEGIAATVRDVVLDTGAVAVIGDLDPRTAAVSAPLLNAAGFLHVSPIAPDEIGQPAEQRTFFALGPSLDDQARAIVAQAKGPFAVEAEPGGEGRADAIRAVAGRTVATDRARTVVYAGSDPVNARGTVRGILRENKRATVIVPAVADIAGPRIRVLAPDTTPPPGFAEAYPGVEPGRYARFGFDAMNDVLAAIGRADNIRSRPDIIRAFRPSPPGALRLVD
jgi:hypothetical protein